MIMKMGTQKWLTLKDMPMSVVVFIYFLSLVNYNLTNF